jgi:hypothetical protein
MLDAISAGEENIPRKRNQSQLTASSSPLSPTKLNFNASTPPTDHSSVMEKPPLCWKCLCCGDENCSYEDGITLMWYFDDSPVFNSEEEEDDPCEPKIPPQSLTITSHEWNEQKIAISECVSGILKSKTFFGHNKFLGTKALDGRLREWLESRVDKSTVNRHWPALRKAVKEVMRFKRQLCVEMITTLWVGKGQSP